VAKVILCFLLLPELSCVMIYLCLVSVSCSLLPICVFDRKLRRAVVCQSYLDLHPMNLGVGIGSCYLAVTCYRFS